MLSQANVPSQPPASDPAPSAPERWGPQFLRRAAAWTLCLSLVVGVIALCLDTALVLRAHGALRLALASGITAAAMAALLAPIVALFVTALQMTIRRVDRSRARLRHLWPLPVFGLALGLGALVTTPEESRNGAWHFAVVALFALGIAGAIALGKQRLKRLYALAALTTLGAIVLDAMIPRGVYREFHELLEIATVAIAMAAAAPLYRRIERVRPALLACLVLCVFAVALNLVQAVDGAVPGWRAVAVAHGRYLPSLARSARALVDFDGDGFSPIAWGGDCDDFNPDRQPLVTDLPGGGDSNCNGVDPPEVSSDADRGLAPAAGDPDLKKDAVDLVLLISIDCLRARVLTPELMPRLSELASQGITFTRAYAGAASTRVSTMLMQRATNHGTPVARRVANLGISTSAVLGLNDDLFARAIDGFEHLERPAKGRWSAPEVTDHALADLRAHPTGKHYLWIHYYDAHTPYDEYETKWDQAAVTPASYPRYLAQVKKIDSALGILIDRLRSTGRIARAEILVTGDHGEGFGEHEVMLHHVSAFEAIVRVPAVLVAPGVAGGVRYDGLVSHRDVRSTLLGGFGLVRGDASAEQFGRSWLRLRGAPDSPLHQFVAIRSGRAVSGEKTLSPMLAIVEGRYKLVETLDDNLIQTFDVIDDPGEHIDITPEMPALIAPLHLHMALFRDLDHWPDWPQPLELGP